MPSPSVTCPSPAITTLPSRRTDSTVVERTSRLSFMGTIADYNRGKRLATDRHGSHTDQLFSKSVPIRENPWPVCPNGVLDLLAASAPGSVVGDVLFHGVELLAELLQSPLQQVADGKQAQQPPVLVHD